MSVIKTNNTLLDFLKYFVMCVVSKVYFRDYSLLLPNVQLAMFYLCGNIHYWLIYLINLQYICVCMYMCVLLCEFCVCVGKREREMQSDFYPWRGSVMWL